MFQKFKRVKEEDWGEAKCPRSFLCAEGPHSAFNLETCHLFNQVLLRDVSYVSIEKCKLESRYVNVRAATRLLFLLLTTHIISPGITDKKSGISRRHSSVKPV